MSYIVGQCKNIGEASEEAHVGFSSNDATQYFTRKELRAGNREFVNTPIKNEHESTALYST